ncbi:YgaP family membrane protein [Brevibacillus sp. NRS-1366]|uniref:YgaP family membrane protein n=1 Tax=Brevibacillus sp. NRS-1366 TaxID=3233899 RepID=UPI003D1DF113
MMQKNVGTTDAMIRITGGLLGLAYGIGKMSRRPYNTPWLLMSLSAMKVAEGVTRFCPMSAMLGVNTIKANGMQNIMDKVKQTGMQAVMNQVTSSMNLTGTTDKQKQTIAPTIENQAATASQSSGFQKESLTAEDERIEQAAREFISYRSQDKHGHPSNQYPTYS